MEFLYPDSEVYPFDKICRQIVHELEKRNWKVPGIGTTFCDYELDENIYRIVSSIRGKHFILNFGRSQDNLFNPENSNVTAINKVVIPEREIRIFSDNSGPLYYQYNGKDWLKDRKKFMNEIKVDSEITCNKKLYVTYAGSNSHSRTLKRANNFGRNYYLSKDGPSYLETDTVMNEFKSYLKDVILFNIMSRPIPAEKIDILGPLDSALFTNTIGQILEESL